MTGSQSARRNIQHTVGHLVSHICGSKIQRSGTRNGPFSIRLVPARTNLLTLNADNTPSESGEDIMLVKREMLREGEGYIRSLGSIWQYAFAAPTSRIGRQIGVESRPRSVYLAPDQNPSAATQPACSVAHQVIRSHHSTSSTGMRCRRVCRVTEHGQKVRNLPRGENSCAPARSPAPARPTSRTGASSTNLPQAVLVSLRQAFIFPAAHQSLSFMPSGRKIRSSRKAPRFFPTRARPARPGHPCSRHT